MSATRRVQVTVDGPISGSSEPDELDALGDALMEALIGLEVEDPFVAIEGERMWLTIELVVNVGSGAEAIAVGSRIIEDVARSVGLDPKNDDGELLITNATARELAAC